MSFESARLRARIATLLIAIVPAIILPISVALNLLFRPAPSDIFYVGIFSSILNYAVYILFLSAMHEFAKYYDDSRIFKNSLYALILSASTGIAFVIVLYTRLLPIIEELLAYTATSGSVPPASVFLTLLQFAVLALLIMLVVGITNGFLYRRAFNALAEKSSQNNFRTAGLLMLIGGILMVILIGALLFFVGWIFAIIGFFSMKPKASQPNTTQQVPQN